MPLRMGQISMMRLTKATHDQLQILVFVARSMPGPIPVTSIGEALGFQYANALKLNSRLVRAGLLHAKRGTGGGVILGRRASLISLGATIVALERANATNERLDWSILELENHSANILESAFALFIEVLDKYTLADLITDTAVSKVVVIAEDKPPITHAASDA